MHPEVARNTRLLAGMLALAWATVQLLMTAGAPMLAVLTGRPGIAGLAPAMYVAWWAIATLIVGRYMDRAGRVPGIRFGFAAGIVGCVAIYAAAAIESLAIFLLGVTLTGGGAGAVHLARAGGADMNPPERRARGISSVVIGAAFGAILGPVVFIPMLARTGGDLEVLGPPFIIAAIVMALGFALTFAVRVDPLDIAREAGRGRPPRARRPLKELLRIPVIRTAMAAALIAQTVMTSMMAVVSLILKDHGHSWPAVSISLSAHFLGMFGLVLVIGPIIDRIGHRRAILLGLFIVVGGVLGMLADVEPHFVGPAMFAVGVGWNLGFIASTAMIADSTEPAERAGLIGFVDFIALMGGAVGSVLAAAVLHRWSLGVLVGGAAMLSAIPALLMAFHRPPRPVGADA